MAELADAQVSEACGRKAVGVQLPLSAIVPKHNYGEGEVFEDLVLHRTISVQGLCEPPEIATAH
jgi:hypothetical protein